MTLHKRVAEDRTELNPNDSSELKYHIQLKLGPHSKRRLEKLRERVEPSTRQQVFRDALRLFEAIMDEVDKSHEFYVKDRDGKFHPYKMFLGT